MLKLSSVTLCLIIHAFVSEIITGSYRNWERDLRSTRIKEKFARKGRNNYNFLHIPERRMLIVERKVVKRKWDFTKFLTMSWCKFVEGGHEKIRFLPFFEMAERGGKRLVGNDKGEWAKKKENGVSTKYKEQNYYNDYYKLIVEPNRLAKWVIREWTTN